MAVAIVRRDWISGASGSGTTVVIPSAAHTAGNALIFFGAYDNASARTVTMSNSGTAATGNGGAWSELSAQAAPSDRFFLWGINNIAGFTGTVTATLSASSQFLSGLLVEVSGADLTAPFNAANLATQTGPGPGANSLTISASPSTQPGLILGLFVNESQHGQIATASVGYTDNGTYFPFDGTSGTNGASNNASQDVARLVSIAYSATGSTPVTATPTVSGQSDAYANFAAFIKEASGGGSGIAPRAQAHYRRRRAA